MKSRIQTTTILLVAIFGGWVTANAQLTIPSDGSDGAFAPTESVEIDLGLAVTATWDTAGTGNGVYDPNQWAVVFKYASVNIPAGVTVTFKNHPTYAPVVWLVQGNVTIDGELNLDGKHPINDVVSALTPAEPGPGGFRGGAKGPSGRGWGYGPGGSGPSNNGFGNVGQYALSYGNPQIIPLIGGSGSAPKDAVQGGSGAGGAIAIHSGGVISVEGLISSKGGNSNSNPNSLQFGSHASGGAVRLVAGAIAGSGAISCQRDATSAGRIRLETNSLSVGLQTFPETIAVPPANPPMIWPAANAPVAKVVSVDAVPAPVDPRAPLVAAADLAIQNNDPVNIVIETQNFPIEGVVQLFVNPKFANRSIRTASYVSGDINQAFWQVQTALPQGFVTLQARATQP